MIDQSSSGKSFDKVFFSSFANTFFTSEYHQLVNHHSISPISVTAYQLASTSQDFTARNTISVETVIDTKNHSFLYFSGRNETIPHIIIDAITGIYRFSASTCTFVVSISTTGHRSSTVVSQVIIIYWKNKTPIQGAIGLLSFCLYLFNLIESSERNILIPSWYDSTVSDVGIWSCKFYYCFFSDTWYFVSITVLEVAWYCRHYIIYKNKYSIYTRCVGACQYLLKLVSVVVRSTNNRIYLFYSVV